MVQDTWGFLRCDRVQGDVFVGLRGVAPRHRAVAFGWGTRRVVSVPRTRRVVSVRDRASGVLERLGGLHIL